MGERAERVHWLREDVLTWRPERRYGTWHDRAVFHFLVEEDQRRAYLATLRAALTPEGRAVLGTFAGDGPRRCSGLPVQGYDPGDLAVVGPELEVVERRRDEHHAPGGTVQPFTWVGMVWRPWWRGRPRGQGPPCLPIGRPVQHRASVFGTALGGVDEGTIRGLHQCRSHPRPRRREPLCGRRGVRSASPRPRSRIHLLLPFLLLLLASCGQGSSLRTSADAPSATSNAATRQVRAMTTPSPTPAHATPAATATVKLSVRIELEPNDYAHRNYCAEGAIAVLLSTWTTAPPSIDAIGVAAHVVESYWDHRSQRGAGDQRIPGGRSRGRRRTRTREPTSRHCRHSNPSLRRISRGWDASPPRVTGARSSCMS